MPRGERIIYAGADHELCGIVEQEEAYHGEKEKNRYLQIFIEVQSIYYTGRDGHRMQFRE